MCLGIKVYVKRRVASFLRLDSLSVVVTAVVVTVACSAGSPQLANVLFDVEHVTSWIQLCQISHPDVRMTHRHVSRKTQVAESLLFSVSC